MKTTKRTTTKKRSQRHPTPDKCNPSWRRSYVTVSRLREWPELQKNGHPIPRTFEGGPGRNGAEKVTLSLSENLYPTGSDNRSLSLKIEFYTGMFGYQKAEGPITVEQAHSLEEGLRAVFEAAREEGLLPTTRPAACSKRLRW